MAKRKASVKRTKVVLPVRRQKSARQASGVAAAAALAAQRLALEGAAKVAQKKVVSFDPSTKGSPSDVEVEEGEDVEDEEFAEEEMDFPVLPPVPGSANPEVETDRLQAIILEQAAMLRDGEALTAELLARAPKPSVIPGSVAGAGSSRAMPSVSISIAPPFVPGSMLPITFHQSAPAQFKYMWFIRNDYGEWTRNASNDSDFALADLSILCNIPVTKPMLGAVLRGQLHGLSLFKFGSQEAHILAARQQTSFTLSTQGKWAPVFGDVTDGPISQPIQFLQNANNFAALVSACYGPEPAGLNFARFVRVTVPEVCALPGVSVPMLIHWWDASTLERFLNPHCMLSLLLRDEHLMVSVRLPFASVGSVGAGVKLSKSQSIPAVSAKVPKKGVSRAVPSAPSSAAVAGVLGQGYTLQDMTVSACLAWNNFSGSCSRKKCNFPHVCGKCGDAGHQMGVPGCQ